jgi:hypothetical protein
VSSWKDSIQLGDLEPDQRLEMTCKLCGHVHYVTPATIIAKAGRATLYLDEVERRTKCKARGCNGAIRLALSHRGDTSGFVGGLA